MDALQTKICSFPERYMLRLDTLLRRLGTQLSKAKELASAVQRLSDFYIEQPTAATPWDKDWAQIAYACYYLPLNYLRVQGALAEARRIDFFNGLSRYTDFGSGCGTVSLAIDDAMPGHFASGLAIERAAAAVRMHKELQATPATPLSWSTQGSPPPRGTAGEHVSIFSYALTELKQIPDWAKASNAIMIVEPATRQDGRRLLAWRAELLAAGWHVWAPCTHAELCPLLTQAAHDWCHDRVHWQAPPWFAELEDHLPMKNPSLAYSYLLLRQAPAPVALQGLARLTGDLRREKGAARQMMCRGSNREFLSWQKRHGEAPVWPRGGLVRLSPSAATKSNEVRPLADECEFILDLPK